MPGLIVTAVRVAGRVHVGRVVGLLAGRRLANGEHEIVGQDDVDLLVEDPVLLGNRDRHEDDAEDVVALAFDRRPRLVLVLCGLEQPLDGTRMELLSEPPLELGFVRIDEVDPLAHVTEASARVGWRAGLARVPRTRLRARRRAPAP